MHVWTGKYAICMLRINVSIPKDSTTNTYDEAVPSLHTLDQSLNQSFYYAMQQGKQQRWALISPMLNDCCCVAHLPIALPVCAASRVDKPPGAAICGEASRSNACELLSLLLQLLIAKNCCSCPLLLALRLIVSAERVVLSDSCCCSGQHGIDARCSSGHSQLWLKC